MTVESSSDSKLKIYSAIAGENHQELSVAEVYFEFSAVSNSLRKVLHLELKAKDERLYVRLGSDVFHPSNLGAFFEMLPDFEKYEAFTDLKGEKVMFSFNEKLTECTLNGDVFCEVSLNKPDDIMTVENGELAKKTKRLWDRKKLVYRYRNNRIYGEYGLETHIQDVIPSEETVSFKVEGLFADKEWEIQVEKLIQQKGTDILEGLGGDVDLVKGEKVYIVFEPQIPMAVRDGLLTADGNWRLMTPTEYEDNRKFLKVPEEQEKINDETKSLRKRVFSVFG